MSQVGSCANEDFERLKSFVNFWNRLVEVGAEAARPLERGTRLGERPEGRPSNQLPVMRLARVQDFQLASERSTH